MKVSLFVESTADGFIAGPDGDMECFRAAHKLVPNGETCGHSEFMKGVDAVVMGRKTYDVVRNIGKWWYGDKPVFVLSRDPSRVPIPAKLEGKISRLEGNPHAVLAALSSMGFERIYLDGGGDVINQFMDQGLVDEATVTTIPFTLDDPSGIPFPLHSKDNKARLKPCAYKEFDFGFSQTKYKIEKNVVR